MRLDYINLERVLFIPLWEITLLQHSRNVAKIEINCKVVTYDCTALFPNFARAFSGHAVWLTIQALRIGHTAADKGSHICQYQNKSLPVVNVCCRGGVERVGEWDWFQYWLKYKVGQSGQARPNACLLACLRADRNKLGAMLKPPVVKWGHWCYRNGNTIPNLQIIQCYHLISL